MASYKMMTKKRLSKAIAALFGTGLFFFAPRMAEAAIVAANGSSTTVNFDAAHNVYDVQTTLTRGNTDINAFKQFDLAKNNIANLHLNAGSANLLNFVHEKVNISGIVNALKDNAGGGSAIGGNLYFLSPNGIVIGQTGVINTGSLTLAVPSHDFMENTVGLSGDGFNLKLTDDDIQKYLDPANIPLNPAGTITVAGKINATGNIYAAAGLDVTVKSGGKITTGVEDFTNFVNVAGSGYDATSGAILTASREAATGDIVLAAETQYENYTGNIIVK